MQLEYFNPCRQSGNSLPMKRINFLLIMFVFILQYKFIVTKITSRNVSIFMAWLLEYFSEREEMNSGKDEDLKKWKR